MKQLLKLTPLALLAVLCIVPFVNASALAPQPAAPSYLLQPSVSTRTVGPPPSWSKTYGNTSSDVFYGMVQCSSGGYALTGYTYSWGAGNADAYLVRVDADGNLLWNKTYGGALHDYGRDIVELSDGGFAIAGDSNSYSASKDIWLIRTDLNGNELWNVTIDGYATDFGYGLVTSSDGGFTIAGCTYSYGEGNADVWLVHTDSSGNHLWNETYGGTNYDKGWDLVESTGGNYVICGRTNSFGAGGYDAWLIRTDASGNHLWNQTYGGTSSEYGYSLIECSSGGFAIAGETYSYGVSGNAVWLVRTDASGNHLWNQTYDAADYDYGRAVIEYSDGGFALAGYTSVPSTRNSETSPRNGPPNNGLLIRTDSNGNMLWNSTYGGSDNDYYYALVECSNGDIVTAGYTDNTVISSLDGWLVKTRYPLVWDPAPTDQTVAYGASLAYDLNASAFFGVDTWTLNDTTNFAISSAGVVSFAVALSAGVYGLRVSVTDKIGSEISGEFKVTLEAPLISPVLIALIAVVAVIIIVVILLLLYFFVLRKRK